MQAHLSESMFVVARLPSPGIRQKQQPLTLGAGHDALSLSPPDFNLSLGERLETRLETNLNPVGNMSSASPPPQSSIQRDDSGVDVDMGAAKSTKDSRPRGAWVRYRTEFRHRTTDELGT